MKLLLSSDSAGDSLASGRVTWAQLATPWRVCELERQGNLSAAGVGGQVWSPFRPELPTSSLWMVRWLR